MQTLEFTIHVNLGVTPELTALVNAILHKETQPVVAASEEPKPEPVRKARKTKAEPEPETPSEDQEVSSEQEESKEISDEEIREAMHKTRVRIEGENYKDNTDSENYKLYHKKLTNEFRSISRSLGADIPVKLTEGSRRAFISSCAELIAVEGEIKTNLPF